MNIIILIAVRLGITNYKKKKNLIINDYSNNNRFLRARGDDVLYRGIIRVRTAKETMIMRAVDWPKSKMRTYYDVMLVPIIFIIIIRVASNLHVGGG